METQQSEGPEHTKVIMIRIPDFKYVKRLYEQDELYDLVNDPQKLVNQIDNPEYAVIAVACQLQLLDHFLATGDSIPLRKDKY